MQISIPCQAVSYLLKFIKLIYWDLKLNLVYKSSWFQNLFSLLQIFHAFNTNILNVGD